MQSGARVFLFVGAAATHAEFAENFVLCLPQIHRILRKTPPPFIGKISRPGPKFAKLGKPGKAQVWKTHEQWLSRLGMTK